MPTRRSRERIQWSDQDRHRELFHLTGTGEAQAIVYFDMGYSQPPVMDYSSLLNMTDIEVKPNIHVTPRGSLDTDVDPNGLSNHSQTSNDIIQDPGFEGQGQWSTLYPAAAAEIPTTEKIMRFLLENDINTREPIYGPQLHWLPIAEAYNDNPPTEYWSRRWIYDGDLSPLDFQGAHLWAQTDDVRERWSLTSTQTHDMGIGEAGKYSATTIIGADGYTNWLIPLNNLGYFMTHFANQAGLQYAEHFVHTTRESPGQYINSPSTDRWFGGDQPPFLGGFEGFAHVLSDDPSVLESKAVFHHWDGDSGGGEAIGDRDEIVFSNEFIRVNGNFSQNYAEGRSYYRIIGTVEDITNVAGGSWQRVDITLPYQGKRAYPFMYGDLYETDDSWPVNPFWRLMYRIKGVPGSTVYIDNIYAWRQLRNVVPVVTVGVESWIRDESGVYIGANLWFKVGQP